MEIKFADTKNNKCKIEWKAFDVLCQKLLEKINKKYLALYPICKNGIFIAERINRELKAEIIYDYEVAKAFLVKDVLIVDDVIDSGNTLSKYHGYDKAVLFVKNNNREKVTYYVQETDKWLQFPFEVKDDIKDVIVRTLQYIGENPKREGLLETPSRVVKSWDELYSGYKQNPKDILKVFTDGACDEMVMLRNVEFYSMCEHHILPFFGKISIGYIPQGKVFGISKLARLVNIFSRRLQIQERMTTQIADAIVEELEPKGVMVVCRAVHLCMISRGIKKQSSEMITSAIRGVYQNDTGARQEFLSLIKED